MSAWAKPFRLALCLGTCAMLWGTIGVGEADAGHRYLRFIVEQKSGGLNARVYELEWKVGATAHPSGGHSASSTCGGTPANAYDGDWGGTYWSVSSVPCTLWLDLGSGTSISADSVRFKTWGLGRAVTEFRCEGSSDNTSWDLLLESTNEDGEGTYVFALAAGAPGQQDVSPVLEFVCPVAGGGYTAHFGYNNPNASPVTIAVGEENKFTGGGTSDWDQGQPTAFQPGRHYDDFTVDFDGSNLVWTLNGHTGTASSGSSQIGCETPEQVVQAAFAFGADSYTEETPNNPGTYYTKVVQNGANFTYSAAQAYGYTDVTDIDGSTNNRGQIGCEIYDQFIGVKNGGDIVFRVDVPNGKYRFVTAGGDAQYGGHNTTLQVRDGSAGEPLSLVDNLTLGVKQYYSVGFSGKTAKACAEASFIVLAESPTLSVTTGYIELIQGTVGTGGDLCLLEIWNVGDLDSAYEEPLYSENFNNLTSLEQGGFVGDAPTYWELDGSGYMATASPGGWEAQSRIFSPVVVSDRARNGLLTIEWQLRLPSEIGDGWREENKTWLSLCDSLDNELYTLLFNLNP